MKNKWLFQESNMFCLKQLTSKGFFAGEQEDAIDNLITVMDLTNAQW